MFFHLNIPIFVTIFNFYIIFIQIIHSLYFVPSSNRKSNTMSDRVVEVTDPPFQIINPIKGMPYTGQVFCCTGQNVFN